MSILMNLYCSDFNNSCVKCHESNAPDLENIYLKYLQVYGSQQRAKVAMKKFLLDPANQQSILPPSALQRFGLHTKQDENTIDKMLEQYFQIYNINNRIIFDGVIK